VSQCRRSSRAQQLISPGCQGIARRKKWRFFTGRRQRLPGAKTDEHASRHGLHLESAICLLTEIVRTMIPGGLSCRAQSALAYADRRIESGERRPDVVEFVAVAKALKVIFLRYLLSGDRGIVDPRPARRARELAFGRAVGMPSRSPASDARVLCSTTASAVSASSVRCRACGCQSGLIGVGRELGVCRSTSTAAQSTWSALQCRVIQIVRAAPDRCHAIERRSFRCCTL